MSKRIHKDKSRIKYVSGDETKPAELTLAIIRQYAGSCHWMQGNHLPDNLFMLN